MTNIITKIKKAKLVGRGGAEYPTHLKWQAVRKTKADKKYVICNASEGELGLFKDIYILKNHPEQVFTGMKLAMDYLKTNRGFFNFNKKYYQQVRKQILKLKKEYAKQGYNIIVFEEHPSYIGGEETALLNAIEGKRTEPRLKPPYPSTAGLFNKPTLIHNVETLFNVSLVADNKFEDKRFYCITGQNKGVFHLPATWSIEKILEQTNNYPNYEFFVQIGGSASGPIYNSKQIKTKKVSGAGSIEIYKANIKPRQLMLKWFEFYNKESCGKCTPCRIGTYNIYQLLKNNKEIKWPAIMDILKTMRDLSFCALGRSPIVPVQTYLKNVLHKNG